MPTLSPGNSDEDEGARAGNDSLPKLSWLPNLLWGLPTALENDFWNELSSAQKFSSLSTAATVALNGAFAWSTTTQFFQKPVGYLSKCLWSWLVIGQPTVLVILALLLSKLQKRLIAQNKSSQYLTWRTILQVAMRLHCLANTVAFERWIAAELVVKEDWSFPQKLLLSSHCVFPWIVGTAYRVPFRVHWPVELLTASTLLLLRPRVCTLLCTPNTQERFAAMSELISRSVSTCVGLGFSPSAFLPHGQGACFAVSVFLFLSVGALPTLLFGIEEVSRTRTLLVTQLDHGTSAFGKAYESGNKVQARQRVSFLERRLPPSRRRRGSLSARASVALLWLRAAILLLPYLAFLWAVAVRASMLAT